MTILEARIRRRLGLMRWVHVFVKDDCVFEDEDVVKLRRVRDGVRIWTYWTGKYQEPEVIEWWFPHPDEVRVERG